MGRLNPADFPANVQDIVNETKPNLLNTISTLRESVHALNEIVKVDEDVLPESVKGLTSKTKQELLEIIARKDAVETQQQLSIKSHVEEINSLSNDNRDIQTKLNQALHTVNVYETIGSVILIFVVLAIILYFVL